MPDPSFYTRMGRLSAIVTILPSTMAAGWFLGYYVIDRYLWHFPWGTLTATFVGAGVGFYEIVRLLMADQGAGK
jgi:F0F1-type ATP synthase assembly protein I